MNKSEILVEKILIITEASNHLFLTTSKGGALPYLKHKSLSAAKDHEEKMANSFSAHRPWVAKVGKNPHQGMHHVVSTFHKNTGNEWSEDKLSGPSHVSSYKIEQD